MLRKELQAMKLMRYLVPAALVLSLLLSAAVRAAVNPGLGTAASFAVLAASTPSIMM